MDPTLLARWRGAIAGGDEALLTLRQRVALESAPGIGAGADWRRVLDQALAAVGEPSVQDNALPDAFIFLCDRQLRNATTTSRPRLSENARNMVLRELRDAVMQLAGPVVVHERAIRQALRRRGDAVSVRDISARYPALARRLVALALRHADAIAEMTQRFDADAALISAAFPGVPADAVINAVSDSLSDGHDGGRSVRVLTLTNGVRLVYKPRSCALERAYFDFLPQVAAGIEGFDERRLTVLDRSTHGWMEYVEHRECADSTEMAAWFRSAGRLAALGYALAGSDLHYENIIADGPAAVPVDLEMLFVPDTGVPESGLTGGSLQAFLRLKDSVLGTVLLPTWVPVGRGRVMDVGGMSGDVMQRSSAASSRSPNRPYIGQHQGVPADHAEMIIAGFTEVYRWFLAERDRLCGRDGPLRSWSGLPVRFINRPTSVYGRLLEESRRIACWRDGVERSFTFERLFLALPSVPETHRLRLARMIDQEVASMEDDDIPCFRTTVGSRDLQLANGAVLSDIFARSGIDCVRDRLAALGDEDLAAQVGLIRMALSLDSVNRAAPDTQAPSLPRTDARSAPGEMIEAAREIFRRIEQSALRMDGSASWMAPQLLTGTRYHTLMPMGHGLYEGIGGIALFAAALHHLDRTPGAAELAQEALTGVHESLARLAGTSADARVATSTATGLAGAVYLLSLAGELLDDPSLVHAASALVPRVGAGVSGDTALDLLTGSAGAILCLLSHHARCGDALALQVARRCGEHLLAKRVNVDGHAYWRGELGALTGLSHGAAGFALALARLARATGESRYDDAAAEALRFERSHFMTDERNWRDLREYRGDQGPMTTWCHGAPGVALGRLGLPELDSASAHDLEIALATTAAHALEHMDHLCCGNLGRVMVSHTAGLRLHRPELVEHALSDAADIVGRARRQGGYGCFQTPTPGFEHPGLFQGIAGIGYALLELAAPGQLPCFLLLE